MTTDSKGGVYFTMGGVFYADPKGVVTKYGTIGGNGIILSTDEKTLYVTGRLMGVATNPADQTPAAVAAAAALPPPLLLRQRDVEAEVAGAPDSLLTMFSPMARSRTSGSFQRVPAAMAVRSILRVEFTRPEAMAFRCSIRPGSSLGKSRRPFH